MATILALFSEPRTIEKTAKTVILSAFLEVWPLPSRAFLLILITSALRRRFFTDFNDFIVICDSHLDSFWR